tara:strand:+ start:366 stop:662 length:297 start_codon:yes stop_codon:yes gene_type:complete
MRAHEVAKFLLASCPTLSSFTAYMFGSSLNGIGSDFDILIIGPSGDDLKQLKGEIKHAGVALPLDVLYMLPEEAEETNFVLRENCIPLEALSKIKNDY